MALKYADRVAETTTTTGTGTYDLGGAKTGFQGFVAGIGDTNTCYYCATNGTDWEVGLGTVADAATDTLSRDTVLASSNAGAAVDWGAGLKDVFCTPPAAAILVIDTSGHVLMADGTRIETDEVRARDGDGLGLYDDAGNGIFVEDGGNVGIGTTTPSEKLEVAGNIFANMDNQGLIVGANQDGTIAWDGTDLVLDAYTVGGGRVKCVRQIECRGDGASAYFSNANISHPWPAMRDTDVGGYAGLASNLYGGMRFEGITDSDSTGCEFRVYVGATSVSYPGIYFATNKLAGASSYQPFGTTELCVQFENRGTDLMKMYGNGDVHLPSGKLGIGTTSPNQKLTVEGTASLKEQAAAGADTAAYGQIWVKNDTPNELYFTDDAGTDTQISPHPKDAPPELYTYGPGFDWIDKRVHHYKGEIHWTAQDGTRIVESFADYNARRARIKGHVDLVQRDWNDYQSRMADRANAKIEAWQTQLKDYRAAVAKWKRLPWPLRGELPRSPGEKPAAHKIEPFQHTKAS